CRQRLKASGYVRTSSDSGSLRANKFAKQAVQPCAENKQAALPEKVDAESKGRSWKFESAVRFALNASTKIKN
ncbi:MAG: hypothetical protein ABI835_13900, partial [Chloroflexota bacterium]